MCPTTGIAYEEPEPNFFSFNSPYGACPSCRGLGTVLEIDSKKIIPDDSLSVKKELLLHLVNTAKIGFLDKLKLCWRWKVLQ